MVLFPLLQIFAPFALSCTTYWLNTIDWFDTWKQLLTICLSLSFYLCILSILLNSRTFLTIQTFLPFYCSNLHYYFFYHKDCEISFPDCHTTCYYCCCHMANILESTWKKNFNLFSMATKLKTFLLYEMILHDDRIHSTFKQSVGFSIVTQIQILVQMLIEHNFEFLVFAMPASKTKSNEFFHFDFNG